jgi:hypothetical protein
VVAALAEESVFVSADTMRAAVADEAVRCGAVLVNGLGHPVDRQQSKACPRLAAY